MHGHSFLLSFSLSLSIFSFIISLIPLFNCAQLNPPQNFQRPNSSASSPHGQKTMHLLPILLQSTLLFLPTTSSPTPQTQPLLPRKTCPSIAPSSGTCSSSPSDYGKSCLTSGYTYNLLSQDPTPNCTYTPQTLQKVLTAAITDANSAYHCPSDSIVTDYVFPDKETKVGDGELVLSFEPKMEGGIKYQDLARVLDWWSTWISRAQTDGKGKLGCWSGNIVQGSTFYQGSPAGRFSLCGKGCTID